MGSDQHVKYWMAHGFPMISSLLLYFDIKQYMHIHIHTVVLEKYVECRAPAQHCVYFIIAEVIGCWLLLGLAVSTSELVEN